MHPEMRYKFCKFYENRARDTPLRGVYIPHFDQISLKISVLGVLYPNRCTDEVEIWHEASLPNFIPSVQRAASAGRKKPKSASEYIKYRQVALRTMLPVINSTQQ